MKSCPSCQAQYPDEMSFCLQDGTPLQTVSASNMFETPSTGEKTLILPQTAPPQSSIETENFSEKTFGLPETVMSQPTMAPTEYFGNQPTSPPPVTTPDTNPNKAAFTAPQFTPQVESKPQRSGLGLLIGVVAAGLLLLVTAVGGVFLYLQPFSSKEFAAANTTSNTNAANQLQTNSSGSSNAGINNSGSNANINASQVFTINSNQGNSSSSNASEKPTPKPSASLEISPKPTSSVTPKPSIEDGTPVPTRTPPPKPTVEDTPPPVPKVVSGGVVNGKAVNLVRPPYPPAARAVHASGTVNVQVTIDENGNVISASAVSGHPLLKQAAEQAARSSKFSPTVLSGQRVKVTGIIVYNFTAQ